jgi:hypothetical protein
VPNTIPDGQWTLNFSNGANIASTQTPALTNAVKLDFAQATSINQNGTTPTFNWLLPSLAPGSAIDSVSINIRNLTDFRGANGVGGNGNATLIYRNQGLSGSTTSFSVLANDSHFLAGNSLQPGMAYS